MFKPLLAWKPEKDQVLEVELAKLKVWPRLVSRKLDGIRATVQGGVLRSRTLKDIPNAAVQTIFKGLPDGLDGELIYGAPNAPDVFNKTTSAVMGNKPVNHEMAKDVKYYLFDYFPQNAEADWSAMPFDERYKALKAGVAHLQATHPQIPVVLVEHFLVKDLDAVLRFEEKWVVNEGFEGVMLRSLEGVYKEGRSTFNEGYLLKVKRFEDGEAVITGSYEMMHNDNVAEVNELGRTKRSSAKENLRPAGVLGGFHVLSIVREGENSVTFDVGSGFNAQQKADFWKDRDNLVGKIIKYKSLKVGEIDKPRHPIFLGFRDKEDM